MATANGLSRRRVGGASSSGSISSSPNTFSSPSSSSPNSNTNSSSTVNNHGTPTTHAGSAFAGGSKIAFDPRDLEDVAGEEQRTGGRVPKLTIMEEVLLLGIKDKQGYLSFWNDNISYALRGCILIELALRRRIALVRDPHRRRGGGPSEFLTERIVEVIDDRQTGETILDETLRMMKAQETDRMSIGSWIDLLSGETWNVLKIGYQLKQVRERLAKGLVDKGVLRTEKRNFLLFDMATHPVADLRIKDSVVNRAVNLLTFSTSAIPDKALDKEGTQCRVMRAVCLACAAYCGSVIDNACAKLQFEERELALSRCEDILAEFSCWPFGANSGTSGSTTGNAARRRQQSRIGMGSSDGYSGRDSILGLVSEVRKEMQGGDDDASFELVAGVLEVLSKLDSLL